MRHLLWILAILLIAPVVAAAQADRYVDADGNIRVALVKQPIKGSRNVPELSENPDYLEEGGITAQLERMGVTLKPTATASLMPEEQNDYGEWHRLGLANGHLVEQVSGQRFDEFLNENIIDPAGLDRTFLYSVMDDPTIPNRAVGYRRGDDDRLVLDVPKPTLERPSVFGLTYGDDEVFSTVEDLFAFGQALKAGMLLEAETLQTALTPVVLGNGESAGYGLGWRLTEGPNGRVIAQHGGSTYGFLAMCTFSTDQNDTTVVLLTNVVSEDYSEVRRAVVDVAWG